MLLICDEHNTNTTTWTDCGQWVGNRWYGTPPTTTMLTYYYVGTYYRRVEPKTPKWWKWYDIFRTDKEIELKPVQKEYNRKPIIFKQMQSLQQQYKQKRKTYIHKRLRHERPR